MTALRFFSVTNVTICNKLKASKIKEFNGLRLHRLHAFPYIVPSGNGASFPLYIYSFYYFILKRM